MTARTSERRSSEERRAGRERGRILTFLAVIGPGIVAAAAGNDSGGISTYSVAGADFGYQLLFLLIVMTFSLVIIQEMAARMGAVTGKGFAALIRERFGIRLAFFAMMALLIANVATTIAQFAGVAAAMEIFGVSRFMSVPVAGAFVWLLVVRGSYRNVEKVFLALSAIFVAYVIAAFMAQPDWGDVVSGMVVPRFEFSRDYVVLAIALTGTTIAPWMQFFTQSNIVDKGLTLKEWAFVRADVITGAVAAGLVAFFIMVTTGAVLHPAGIGITSAEEAAAALAPVAGQYASALFAIGLLAASLLAAAVLPLTASYAVCEAFGWESGLDRTWSEAPAFNAIYTGSIVTGVLFVLIPGLDLIKVMILSQTINGVMLPFLLLYMIRLVNDRSIMGRHVNGPVHNGVVWVVTGTAISMTVLLLVMTVFGFG